jgi:hypothetical protein
MNQTNIKRAAIALAALALPALMGCGKSNNDAAATSGSVPAYYNGSGYYNGYAIGSAGCIPLTGQAIPFTISQMYFDSANLVAGRMPRTGQVVGQVMVAGGYAPQGYGSTFYRQGVDGTLQISVNQTNLGAYSGSPYTGYPYSQQYSQTAGLRDGTGVLQINPQTLQDIQYQFSGGGYYGSAWGGQPATQYGASYPTQYYPNQFPQFTGQYQSQICVSGIAIEMGHYNQTLYGGNVYLYLNGSDHGYVIPF